MSPSARVLLLVLALAVAGGALFAWLWPRGPVDPTSPTVGALLLLVLFAATEAMDVHIEARGGTYTLAFSEAPLVVGFALAAPVGLIAGRLAGTGLTLRLYRRQPFQRLAFNLSMMAVETGLAILVYRGLLGSAEVISPRGVAAALVATMAADSFGVVAVTVVMWLYSGQFSAASVRRTWSAAMVTGVANAAIGVGVVAAILRNPWFLLPLGFSAVVLFLLYRAYVRLNERYTGLATLHDFSRLVSGSLDLSVAASTMLASARRLLRAHRADLLLLGDGGGDAIWVSDRDGEITLDHLPDDEARRRLRELLPESAARLIGPGAVPEFLVADRARSIAVSPISVERGLVGAALAVDPVSDVSAFSDEDLTLFETLANHASVSLENSGLFARLKAEAAERTHQALHDPLTGLPNRQLLEERIVEALADARSTEGRMAVVLIDLEGFKEVNDALGHQAGDAVLQALCERLDREVPPGATIARLGGDEFVLVLPRVDDADDAVRRATPLLDVLNAPVRHGDLTLVVGARMGLALYPDHGNDPATLLQRADVAMYDARSSLTRHELYAPERDPFTPQRLALVAQLREAIGRREIEVWFQPQLDLRTQLVVGAEALVRWRHPERGVIEPGDFLPFSDRSGLARPLAVHVLGAALERCRVWHDRGMDLSVAVNLSVRNLIDPGLPGDILALLVDAGVSAECLVLEVTESSIMTESRRSLQGVSQLHEMGVQLSIDDFGTGYSSLSRLRNLPVAELKIDKGFVIHATTDAHDAAIVMSTVELGHRLGLRVVGEGAENADTVTWLGDVGCDVAQGYFLSRPLAADVFDLWLDRHATARITR